MIYRNGAPVRLSDLGRVIDSNEDVRNLGIANGVPMVVIQISRQPNANIIDTVARVKALMPMFEAQLPPTVKLSIDSDRTLSTKASVHDAQRNMLISILLVIFVVFAFLRNGRATFIPSVSVPVSLIATFGAMYLIGYNLDNLSLMSLTIATGFVVDDAIVVIENIMRHIENGMQPMAAALHGVEEIGFTVLSNEHLADCRVYSDSHDGRHCGPGCSVNLQWYSRSPLPFRFVISLTATPMMCARLLEGRPWGTGVCIT